MAGSSGMTDWPRPNETALVGRWVKLPLARRPFEDATCKRVWRLRDLLTPVARCPSGWEELFLDPHDGRLWLFTFPEGGRQGGGPPALVVQDEEAAALRFSRKLIADARAGRGRHARPGPLPSHRLLPLGFQFGGGSLASVRDQPESFSSGLVGDALRTLDLIAALRREQAVEGHERSRAIARTLNAVEDTIRAGCARAAEIEARLCRTETLRPPVAEVEAPLVAATGQALALLHACAVR